MGEGMNWNWLPFMLFLLWMTVMGIRQDRRERRRKLEELRRNWKAIKAKAPWWTEQDYFFEVRYPEKAAKK